MMFRARRSPVRDGFVLIALLLAGTRVACATAAEGDAAAFNERVLPLLKSYCHSCHGGEAKEGNLSLSAFVDVEAARRQPELWWKVLKNLRSGVMPPVGEKRPSAEELEVIASAIKFEVFQIRANDPDPGRLSVRRLNRREYGNTISDLMGIEFDAAIVFPPDDSGFGFDNVGDALSFSPLLMEKYLRSAQAVVERAVPTETWIVPQQEFRGRDFEDEKGKLHGDSLSSKTAARVGRKVRIDKPGQYKLDVAVKLHGSFNFDPSRYTILFTADGQERFTREYGWDENKLHRHSFTEDWQPGEHELVFELTPVASDAKPLENVELGGSRDETYARFEVSSVRVEGPQGTDKLVHPRGYARYFPREQPPASVADRREYAREILSKFATRAFRSPADSATVERLIVVAEQVYSQPNKTFEAGVAHAFVAALASPRFLFRLEATVPASTSDVSYAPVSELSLASRLSYFLWSTMPDEELFRLAESGELRQRLPQQVERMMRDDRAKEFVRNFSGQWLRTRDVSQVSIDPVVIFGRQAEFVKLQEQFRNFRSRPLGREVTPEEQKGRDSFRELRALQDRFNDEMKRAMRRETEMTVEYIVREDRSLLDLLDCDYTFLNEKLAELYGIPGVRGSELRRVTLPEGSPRGGVLTQASFLLVTSNPTRTSPVKRGLFVLENILGTPAPPAPPNIPDLEEAAKKFAGREPPLRELLAAHRESALCASCHSRMDPLGIALENFNALGIWRDTEKDQPIDATGTLITGESFHDIRELKKILRERHADDFYRCVTGKLLTYALGRGLDYGDEHSIDLIVDRLRASDGKFSTLLQGVIESAPFQKQRLHDKSASVSGTQP